MSIDIVACAANENKYINEWISYHYRLGFDHFYIYCNDQEPEELYKNILPWIQMGIVTFHHHAVRGDQRGMYLHYLHVYKSNSEWVSFLDVDEFFSIRECDDIKSFIEKRKDLDCIYFNWLNFGTNGYKTNPNGLSLDLYTHREKTISKTLKVIVKGSCLDLQFMVDNPSTFQHGLGQGDWLYTPFNGQRNFNGQNVIGHSVERAWSGQDHYTQEFSEKIIWTATVSHYYLRSEEHFKYRSQRGKDLGPGWELEWTQKYESGAYLEEIARANSTHDVWLATQNKKLIRKCGVYLKS